MIPYNPFDPRPSADRPDAFIATGTALLIAGLAAAGARTATSVYAANKQSDVANQAANLESGAAAQQLDFQKQQAARDQENWQRSMQFNIDQYNAQQNRLAPYRNLGVNANSTLSRLIGGDNVVPLSYTPPPAQLPPLAGAPATTTATTTGQPPPATSTTASTTAPDLTGLSDPASWMSLVGDPQKLTAFVQQGLGPTAPPDLVSYYVGKIKGQPGANPTEQAGSAKYWLEKMQNDPKITGLPPAAAKSSLARLATVGPQTPTLPNDFTNGDVTAPTSSLSRLVRTPTLAQLAQANQGRRMGDFLTPAGAYG